MYLGDFSFGETVAFTFNSRGGTGAPATLTNSPAIAVRKNAGTPAMTLDAAPTLTVDLGGVTGLNGVSLILSDTDFVTGEYDLVLTAGVVDSTSVVGAVIGHFSVDRANMIAKTYAAVQNITVGSAAISKFGDSVALFGANSGTEAGAVTDTYYQNDVYYSVIQTGGTAVTIDTVFEFDIGVDGIPVSVLFNGRLNRTGTTASSIAIQVFNYVANAWQTRFTVTSIRNSTATNDTSYTVPLYISDVGQTATVNDGKVRVRFVGTYTSGQGNQLYVDQIFINYTNYRTSIGYADGAIWVDTVNGHAGAVPYVNGTADYPCLTYADAESLENTMGITRFHIVNGSTITITGAMGDIIRHTFIGERWNLVLNAVGGSPAIDVTDASITGAKVTGVATGKAHYYDCRIGALTGLSGSLIHCAFVDDVTLAAGNSSLVRCWSARDDSNAPKLTWSAGSSILNVRDFNGGLEMASMTADHLMKIEITGRLTLANSCTGGSIYRRGLNRLVDNTNGGAGGAVTMTDGYGTTIYTDADEHAYVDLRKILGSAITGVAANIVAGFKKFFEVASPSLTVASKDQTGDVYAQLPANFSDLAIADTAGTVTAGNMVGTAPTVDQIKTKMEEAGGTLALTKASADAAARPGASMVASNMIAAAPTVEQIKTKMEEADGKLDVVYDTVVANLDSKVSLAGGAGPTVEQIRAEMEEPGSVLALTKASADAAARPGASMVASNMIAAAPTVEQIKTKMEEADGKLDVVYDTVVANLDTKVSEGGVAPTVEQIRTELEENGSKLNTVYDTVVANLDGKISDIEGGTGDDGLDPWTITVYLSDGVTPDPAAQVWLTADAAGTLPALRTPKTTNDLGQVVFHLDSGVVYYVQSLGSEGQEGPPERIVGA